LNLARARLNPEELLADWRIGPDRPAIMRFNRKSGEEVECVPQAASIGLAVSYGPVLGPSAGVIKLVIANVLRDGGQNRDVPEPLGDVRGVLCTINTLQGGE